METVLRVTMPRQNGGLHLCPTISKPRTPKKSFIKVKRKALVDIYYTLDCLYIFINFLTSEEFIDWRVEYYKNIYAAVDGSFLNVYNLCVDKDD